MSDLIFEEPRLVAIYDAFDGPREDLDHYLAIAKELNARSVIDIGCGTGCFADLLSEHGFDVIGLDPARASLEVARRKPNAKRVHWVLGDSTKLSPTSGDMAVMTGNVAQVFLSDETWEENLSAIRQALRPTGHLVFEARRPEQKPWLEWTREKTYQRLDVPKIGYVEGWCEVIDVSEELVRFRWTYAFESDGRTISSDSTLRFRDQATFVSSLRKTGYKVIEIREAPDRPGQEFVFIAALS